MAPTALNRNLTGNYTFHTTGASVFFQTVHSNDIIDNIMCIWDEPNNLISIQYGGLSSHDYHP